jgi:4-aminobutyrate aminotransferase/(S)-3-amino-2-methylpropionate transaminase
VYRVPTSYPYRDGLSGPEAAARAIAAIETQVGAHNVAAIVIEPIQGEGGFIVPAEGFLPELAAWAQRSGVLFIADEIQTGFCRTGEWFAVEHEGVVPDLVTTAKGLAGGMPLAAVTGRPRDHERRSRRWPRWDLRGNPVAARAALATIATMRTLDLESRAREIGARLMDELHQLAAQYPAIGDVRGRGAMVAVEFVVPGTQTPDPALTKAIIGHCTSQGVVAISCGTYGNVVRFLPPLIISDDQLHDAMSVLRDALAANS